MRLWLGHFKSVRRKPVPPATGLRYNWCNPRENSNLGLYYMVGPSQWVKQLSQINFHHATCAAEFISYGFHSYVFPGFLL